ncbi:MAG: cytochrome P450 [Myxococcota bacterium]
MPAAAPTADAPTEIVWNDPGFRDNPFPLLAELRERAPVSRAQDGTWRLLRYDDVIRLLREVPSGVRLSDGTLPGRDRPGGFMLLQDPPDHTRLRKLVSKAFTPRAVEHMRPKIQRITDDLLDAIEERGELDVIRDLALPVPATVICEMLGVPVHDRDTFTSWTSRATHLLVGELEPDLLTEASAAAGSLAEYFRALIDQRRGQLGDDLLSSLIRAEEEGDRLSADELLVQSIGLLIAGFETTIGLIGNGVRALLLHPDELRKLRENPGLIVSAVEECLRFDGPIPATLRILREPTEFGGHRIPPDVQIFAFLYGANRDPEHFPEPDRFDVSRSPNDHLAFGGGVHMCLGAHLARLEAQIAIGTLVRRLPGLELASEELVWGESLFRVLGTLPVYFQPTS